MKAYIANIVTCDQEFHLYQEGLMVTDEEKIVYVGPRDQEWLDKCEEISENHQAWILPGLVNTHVHTAMTLLRGISDDENLYEWLEGSIWPAESRFTPEITTTAVELAVLEMLQSGTTTFNDMYNPSGVEIDAIYEVIRLSGIRAYFSPTLFSSDSETTNETIARTREILEKIISYQDERFSAMVAPHAPYTCDEELLLASLDLARELDRMIHIHVAETEQENQIMLERTGLRPLAYLEKLGYLEHPAVFAHGVELSLEEMTRLGQSPVSVAHNPISNLKLASGVADVIALKQAGVTVGLATDSVASNNNLDLFEEGRTAAFLQKAKKKDASYFTIQEVLQLMTLEGAKALGMANQIGSLEVGKQADFLVIHPEKKAHLYPLENMLSHLVYAVKGSDISHVYIGGKQVVKDGEVLTLDARKILEKASRL